MSFLQLIRSAIKETDKKSQKIPKKYYFISSIFPAITIALTSYLINPYLDTWTIEALIGSITMMSLVLSGIFLAFSFIIVISVLFFSILVIEKRREIEENSRVIASNLRQVISEEFAKVTETISQKSDDEVKNLLKLANSSYQNLKKELDEFKEEKNREVSELRAEIQTLKQTKEESKTIIADKIQGNNKIEDPKP